MESNKRIHLFTIILLLAVSMLVGAQEFGRQTGTVKDKDGNPIGDVTITAGKYTVKTDANGKFVFLRLPPRVYPFRFEKEGYQPAGVNKEVAAIFNNRPINMTLQPLPQQMQMQKLDEPNNANLVKEGQQLFQAGDVEGALKKFEAVLANDADNLDDPNILNSRYIAGVCYWQLQNYNQALEYLEPLGEKLPDHLGVNLALGEVNFYSKNFEKALPYYKKLVVLEKADANVFLNIGIAHEATEARDEAINAFMKSIEMDATLDDAYWRLGLALSFQEKYGEAIPYLEKYLELQPEGPFAEEVTNGLRHCLLEHGIALFNAGNTEEAMPILQRIIDEYPDSEEAGKAKVLLEEQQ